MRRAGAVLMLVVAVFWAASPAFACMLPAQPHACCQAMPDCSPAMMGADDTCCQMHSPDTSNLPDLGFLPDYPVPLLPVSALMAASAAPDMGWSMAPAVSPSVGSPPMSSVLRI